MKIFYRLVVVLFFVVTACNALAIPTNAPTPTITGQLGTTNYLYETNESFLLCIPLGTNYFWPVEEDWWYTDPGDTNISDKVYLRNTTNGAVVYFGSDDEFGNVPRPG